MSGFFGIVGAGGAPVEREILGKIARAMEFRGPDATSVCLQEGAGFCFTFFRTGPAPQSRTQPCTLDGNAWLIGDIRLDGREELLGLLQGAGQDASDAATDEELALHAWRAWGEDAPKRLMGDFAFAVWEQTHRQLSCFRDVIGVTPFYYAHADGLLAFSNTLDVLRLVPGVHLSLDQAWVGDFLLQGFSSYQDRTIYRGVKRLPAGHALKFADGHMTVARYTSLPIEEPLFYRDRSQYVDEFRELFTRSVRERLPDGQAAIFMSGGLDSTSVAGIAAKLLGTAAPARLRAFHMDLNPAFADEEPVYAKQAALHFAIPIEIIPLGDEQPFASWCLPELRTPEPSHEPFICGNRQMYADVARFARVALCGDGGDDILLGKLAPYVRYSWKNGQLLRTLCGLAEFLGTARRWPTLGTGLRGRWRRWRSPAPPPKVPAWIDAGFAQRERLVERLKQIEAARPAVHPVHAGYRALNGEFWASVMEEEDAAWVGAALQRRAPFLDRRIIAFLLRLPPVPWCMEKELVRQAMRRILPEAVRTRRKTPVPVDLLASQAERLAWNPPALKRLCAEAQEYVNWENWKATFGGPSGSEKMGALRPVSLHHWLKAVENT